jgi:hypothetical protein
MTWLARSLVRSVALSNICRLDAEASPQLDGKVAAVGLHGGYC